MRKLILPFFELLYRLALRAVQLTYSVGLRKIHRLGVPVVSVGNITWGGTGKTPLVMKLAKAFQGKGRSVAVLTRGYGNDEAKLLSERLSPIPVLVGPDRVATGRKAVQERGADLLLLDDGFQQWRLKKDLEILTVDATLPFGNGHLIPRGILREPIAAARRADLIVVTKADLNPWGLKSVEGKLRSVNPEAPIFFARYRPIGFTDWSSSQALSVETIRGRRICSMAGIAQPLSFEETLKNLGAQIDLKVRFPDHHCYALGELVRLLARCQRHSIQRIVTTAKDAVRIPRRLVQTLGPTLKGIQILVLEIELDLERDEEKFLHRIDSVLAG